MLIYVKSTVIKLQERWQPLKLFFALFSAQFQHMVSNKAAAISSIFTKVVGKFYENKHLTLKDLDNAKLQYEEFINHVASRYQEELVSFNMICQMTN